MNLDLIKINLRMQLKQIEKIEELRKELKVIQNLEFYQIALGGIDMQILDVEAKQAEIKNEELILIGMLK